MIFGPQHALLRPPRASPLQKQFVQDTKQVQDYPHGKPTAPTSPLQIYKAGVEAPKAKNAVAGHRNVIKRQRSVKVALGGPATCARTTSLEQTFYPGITTTEKYDFPTLGRIDTIYPTNCRSAGSDFWKWIETATIKL